MRGENILEEVATHKMSGAGNHIVITCADGHQCPDVIRTHENFLLKENNECCCHPLTMHGGALVLSKGFIELAIEKKLTRFPLDEVLLESIDRAMCLKGITTVAPYIHAPCGMAGLLNLTFKQTLLHLFEAKKRILNEFASKSVQVACYVQVDYKGYRNEKPKSSYFITRKKWEPWHERHFSAAELMV